MSISLECKKVKRTGFLLSFLGGGVLAAVVPVLNMAARSELFLGQEGNAMAILLSANWNMMAMLNLLLLTLGACIMYHTEYADNAMQKMRSLPVKESKVFLGKCTLMIAMSLVFLGIEFASLGGCAIHWFGFSKEILNELVKSFGYAFCLIIPVTIFTLVIASACNNMWISLGIGVVCIFAATINPHHNFWISLFPFGLPFETLAGSSGSTIVKYLMAVVVEIGMAAAAEAIYLKVRREVA